MKTNRLIHLLCVVQIPDVEEQPGWAKLKLIEKRQELQRTPANKIVIDPAPPAAPVPPPWVNPVSPSSLDQKVKLV